MSYNKTIHIKISEDLYKNLHEEARAVNLSLSAYIRSGLTHRNTLPIVQLANQMREGVHEKGQAIT